MTSPYNPYQPPAADIHPDRGAPASDGVLVAPPSGLVRVVLVGLAATAVVAAVAIVADLAQIALLERGLTGSVGAEEADVNDTRMMAIGIGYIVSFVAAAIAFAMWLAAANRTARSLAPRFVTFTPTWIVGWFFVPIANLWKPYQAVKELWVASSMRDPGNHGDVPGSFPLWWTAWIVTYGLGRYSSQLMARTGNDLDAFIAATRLEMAVDVLRIVLAGLAAAVVLAIARAQERAFAAASQRAAQGPVVPGTP